MSKTRILFICTANACRSQMAEGFANALRGDVIEAFSAGVLPIGVLDETVEVMKEAGVDISKQYAKRVSTFINSQLDYVITLCDPARESCPVFLGETKVVHHGFEDPPYLARNAKTREEALDHFRRIRDEIKAFVLTLPESRR